MEHDTKAPSRPHIIFFLADDLGWNDVSFHGSRQIPTPNIDALAAHGVVLQRHYATPVCSPSRAAFMTARYPTRVGIGYMALQPASKAALPLNIEVLPQWLKRQGYSTHMVGKNDICGLDFWRSVGHTTQAVTDLNGTYSTYVFTDEAKRIIAEHDSKKPLFLYLSYQAVHSGCKDCDVEAPEEVVDRFAYIKAHNRTLFAGALHLMDRSIGDVLEALQSRGMLADSIVVFASDNGGAPMKDSVASNAGSNWPLRGVKENVWEGGVRTPAVFWYGRLSDRLPLPPSQQMIHITDWAPTFYAAAGGDVSALGDVDGMDQWEALSSGTGTGHEDLILEIEGRNQASAIISGRYKLVNRSLAQSDPLLDSRLPRPEGDPPEELDLDTLMKSSKTWCALQQASIDAGACDQSVPREKWREELVLTCNGDPDSKKNEQITENFDPYDTAFVFDIISDPCELNNLAASEPQLRDKLLSKLVKIRAKIPINPMTAEEDERGYPQHHECAWSTWLDVEPAEYQTCAC
ncbi:hypothetical protein HPB50_004524 [Hyalomma asiaticum]|uniref:Uncharacterized protein n=1 Tax=Hyalomma asiaticum TaxID=266040 RepID=A0ACB7RR37_HYAAI|nr:hypothetical protein HPB50_004524 [Hyalomma asiaticum]